MARAVRARRRAPGGKQLTAPYDVVALVASAGGAVAIETVLRALPSSFPIPVIVMLHLPHGVSEPLRGFTRRLSLAVEWAQPDALLEPGRILVAPPRSFVEILPNGVCVVSPCARGALDHPMDRLLRSLAQSFAHRALGVVLSGMLSDGAEGARELRSAGGCVIVQTGAEYASMPNSVLRVGGADATLPVEEIADLLLELAAGAPVPRRPSESDAVNALFAGQGLAATAMRAVNWSQTALGPVLEWPPALSTAVRNALSATFPTCIFWGPAFVQIYNEAFLPLLGAKPAPAGRPARLTWPELWSVLGPRLESVLRTGAAVFAEDQLFQPERHGYPEEMYLTYSYSALHDSDGSVRGVLHTATDSTERVRARRRLEVVRDLAGMKSGESSLSVAENAAQVLANAPLDLPFALFYLFQKGQTRAHLAAVAGLTAGTEAAPHSVDLVAPTGLWPLAQVARSGCPCTLNDLGSRLRGLHTGPWPEPPSSALLLPLWSGADGPIAGVLVLGLSPRLRFDPTYEEFLRVVAQHIGTVIGEAEARRRERERSERLAELDRAKIEFFSNVSHEFRTPLTLLLGPLEELLLRRAALPSDLEGAIEAAARNGRRLLTLVNSLLDFSQAEAQRERAQFEATDLGALTLDLANEFRSAIEGAGLRFEVKSEPGMRQLDVDRQMWEKIVSNLLSNALKFTFAGEITVELRSLKLHAQLEVKDTGIGIPERELPNLFKRFHRVRGARARTADGSGIGLWMVDDLVKRIGGQLHLRSTEGVGTAFTIWIPFKSARSGAERAGAGAAFRPTEFASQAAREAARWAVDSAASGSDVLEGVFGVPALAQGTSKTAPRGRLLVVDDNADMREYLGRLLSQYWQIATAADGAKALEVAAEMRPDVILADVMMPELDGFELLKRLRVDPELRHTPVVLLTARAGEQAAIEGLLAGGADYIAKPFSPRELVARVSAAVERARAEAALRRSEEKYRKLFDSIDEGFCIIEVLFDRDGKAFDYRFIEMNRAFVAQAGLGDATDKTMRELVPEHEDFWFETYGEVARTGQARRFEHQARALNRWYDVYAFRMGAPDERRVAVLSSDVSERRRTEAELLERNDELERFNLVTVDRELRMIELKHQINSLRARLGEPPRYHPALEPAKGNGGV